MKYEAFYNGAIYTRNLNHLLEVDFINPTIILLVPKLGTDICMRELKEANNLNREFKDKGIQLYSASTDSPEAAQVFLPTSSVPHLHIGLSDYHFIDYLDCDGYAKRTTVFIKGNQQSHETFSVDEQRSIYELLNERIFS